MSTNKSFSTETSERYSRALFEVAQEASELEKIENDIKNFASLLNNSLEIKNFIHNPTQSKENQNNVIKLLAEKLNFSKNLKNFMFLLIEKRRIFFIAKIWGGEQGKVLIHIKHLKVARSIRARGIFLPR